MKIWGITEIGVRAALKIAGRKHYTDNLCFNRQPETTGVRVKAVLCTIRVHNSRKPGARRSQQRRLTAACYHAHEHFYREAFALGATRIQSTIADWSSVEDMEKDLERLASANIGSIAEPLCHADACECDGEW